MLTIWSHHADIKLFCIYVAPIVKTYSLWQHRLRLYKLVYCLVVVHIISCCSLYVKQQHLSAPPDSGVATANT